MSKGTTMTGMPVGEGESEAPLGVAAGEGDS